MVLNVPPPELKLQELDARTLGEFLSAAADLTITLDSQDAILDVSQTLRDVATASLARWRGRRIEDVVRPEHREALRTMLAATRSGKPSRRLDVTHPLDGGRDLPMQYSAFRLDGDGRVILVGRDLRALADMQSQLLDNRQSLEQNSRRQRQAEAHYRLLFETAAEAMVIVDPDSGKVREANPRAVALLAASSGDLVGRKFAAVFAKPQQAEVQAALAQVLSSGRKVALVADAGAATKAPLDFGFELFRAGDLKLVLVRMAGSSRGEQPPDAVDESLGDLVRNATEAILLSDDEGEVQWVNEAFLAIAGLPLAANAVGRRLESFFRWSGIEEGVLLANIRRHGRVPTFAAIVRGANGQTTEVDLSAVVRKEGTQPGFGFVMRVRGGDEQRSSARGNSDLTRTAESLAEMVGRVPMKDMVRDTTDVIERLCIEAALKLTGNNRASAARVLGLSRQALYLKMNRFGIADDGES